jgi:hypothetical protein
MSDDTLSTWHVQINGGPEQVFQTRTSQYGLAALAALAMLEYEDNADYNAVKIWVPNLLPHYGPYFYAFDGYSTGRVEKHREF